MKILFTTNQFYPPRSTGSGRSSSLIYRELKRRGHEIDLLIFDKKLYEMDYKNTLFYNFYRKSNFISIITEFLKIKDGTYDIIHQYGGGTFKYLLPVFCKNFQKTKLVTTINGNRPGCWNSKNYNSNSKECCRFPKNVKCALTATRKRFVLFHPYTYLGYKFKRFYTKKYDRYFMLSNAINLLFLKAGFDKTKSTVIPNFFDQEVYEKIKTMREKNHERKKSERIIILYVGRIDYEKGVHNLINVFKSIKNKNVELRIIGDGQLKNKLQKENINSDRIKFLGLIQHNSKEFLGHYNESDIFVHPGIWPEPFGRTILEAAISKNAIIVSNIGAPPEILQDNALIYEPHDMKGLADCLLELINNSSKRKELAIKAYNHVIKEYNVENSITKLEREYEQILKGK